MLSSMLSGGVRLRQRLPARGTAPGMRSAGALRRELSHSKNPKRSKKEKNIKKRNLLFFKRDSKEFFCFFLFKGRNARNARHKFLV